MLVIILSCVNLIILPLLDYYLLFSATAPLLVLEVAYKYGTIFDNSLITAAGYLISFLIIGVYFLFWILSKRRRSLILVSFILFALDTFLLVGLMIVGFYDITYLLDLAVHILILIYLLMGVIAWAKLRKIDPKVANDAVQLASVSPGKRNKYFGQTVVPTQQIYTHSSNYSQSQQNQSIAQAAQPQQAAVPLTQSSAQQPIEQAQNLPHEENPFAQPYVYNPVAEQQPRPVDNQPWPNIPSTLYTQPIEQSDPLTTSQPFPYNTPYSQPNPYSAPSPQPNPYSAPSPQPNPYSAPSPQPNPYTAPSPQAYPYTQPYQNNSFD